MGKVLVQMKRVSWDVLFYDDIIVYVFNKADTFELYKKWKERTLD